MLCPQCHSLEMQENRQEHVLFPTRRRDPALASVEESADPAKAPCHTNVRGLAVAFPLQTIGSFPDSFYNIAEKPRWSNSHVRRRYGGRRQKTRLTPSDYASLPTQGSLYVVGSRSD